MTDVSPSTPPADIMRAIGFEPATHSAVIVTPTYILGIAADYPGPTDPEPEPEPEPDPEDPGL